MLPLDDVNGPVLTVEGRDEGGAAFTAYVRLWPHATGTGADATVLLDFASVRAGFAGDGPPVWMGDVDRLFVSLAPPGYVEGADASLAAPAEGWAELTAIACEGPGSVLAIGDVVVPPHGFGIATGYDDQYNLTPARVLRNVLGLGYRGAINHYVGMSHYPRLAPSTGSGQVGLATAAGGALATPAAAWQADFARQAAALGYDVIWSLSFELLDQLCPPAWKQRAANGSPALTGYLPPSTLLSPAHAEAMAYLQAVAAALMGIALAAGLAPRFQVGEPWWWLQDDAPCLYDAAAVAAFAPAPITDVRGALDADQLATLDRAGACLAAATAALAAAARTAAPGCVTHLLAYLPDVLDPPAVQRANLPLGWAWPAFDVLQLEDYAWCAAGDTVATARGVALAGARLGYPAARQHYLAGFVADAADAGQWRAITDAAARHGRAGWRRCSCGRCRR